MKFYRHKKFALITFIGLISIWAFWNYFQYEPKPQFLMPIEKLLNPQNVFNSSSNIALISVLDKPESVPEFQFALSTVRCYALRHNYAHFVLLSPNEWDFNGTGCAQEDFMFRRHCVIAHWMEQNPQFEWIFFLDADIGVVNPIHRLEEFIRSDEELVFIDRLFNSEIMAGSYLTKNTPFSREFLQDWASFNFRLPDSVHGSDNGAIEALFMEKYAQTERKNACQILWENSKNYADLNNYEVCVRHFIAKTMRNRTFDRGRVKVLEKANGWVRDGGHTRTKFSNRDFMLHGWRKSTFNHAAFNPWHNPFALTQHFDNEQLCANGTEWKHKGGFYEEEDVIQKKLDAIIEEVEKNEEKVRKDLKLN